MTDNPLSSASQRLVQVFRSPREEGMYLYVDKQAGLDRVPQELLERFGKPESALMLVLTPERKLASANADKVLAAIASQGFYLQMPPPRDAEMQAVRLQNQKLQQ